MAAEASRPTLAPTTPSVSPALPVASAGVEEGEGDLAVALAPALEEGGGDAEGAQWPDDAAEVAFLAEQGSSADPVGTAVPAPAPLSAPSAEAPASVPLPPLQTLVDRIPAEAREVLEDLFRARFVSVKRVQHSVLQSPA